MNRPDRLLPTLDPPAGGRERLIRRRDKEAWLTPAAALTCAFAAIALCLSWPHRQRLEFNLDGARLIGGYSRGVTLQMLDDQRAVELPSGDPNVRLYRIERQKPAAR